VNKAAEHHFPALARLPAIMRKLEKMRKSIMLLIMATTGFFSWGQGRKSLPDTVYKATPDSIENVQRQKPLTNHNEGSIDTKYEYRDSTGGSLIIQNSLPKGGLKYTDANGAEYVYAVFWTRIINETANPFEFTIDFPLGSYELPSSPGNYFKIVLPSATMTPDQEPLFNYGLAGLKFLLDYGLHKSSSLKRTINPKEWGSFYVVTLSNKGLDGTLRTGFSLKEQNLFYRINDKEIHCGKINLKNLVLQK
jgi:hypothetical protein